MRCSEIALIGTQPYGVIFVASLPGSSFAAR